MKPKLLSVEAYRPITLANVDYKVFMKVLAKRLQCVIQSLVGQHQTCGKKGRSITTNLHVFRSLLETVDSLGGRVAILKLDLAKAFDRATHDILFAVLEQVNVGSIILEGVKMSCTNSFTSLIVNKKVSEKFEVVSGVKQGCPLRALLFAIYLELFCLKLLSSNQIRGFTLHESEVKVLCYADDVAVVRCDKESVRRAVRVATEFCEQTGSAINWSKCIGTWRGDWEATQEEFANVNWNTSPTRYIGVPLQWYQKPTEFWSEELKESGVKR